MPCFQTGNMWSAYNQAGLFLITTNSTITRNGRLVMGRGIAKQARDRFPGLAAALGQQIQQQCGSLGTYGLLISSSWPTAKLGAFQVKYHFSETADLSLIKRNATTLHRWATGHPDIAIHLNMPVSGTAVYRVPPSFPLSNSFPTTSPSGNIPASLRPTFHEKTSAFRPIRVSCADISTSSPNLRY